MTCAIPRHTAADVRLNKQLQRFKKSVYIELFRQFYILECLNKYVKQIDIDKCTNTKDYRASDANS